jgi:predicted RNA-binding Zn ribbon-like protein
VVARRLPGHASPLSADSIEVAVRDRGIGIAPSDLEVVFEEFHQLDTPAALGNWLADEGLLDQPSDATDDDLQLAHEMRETLRSLAIANGEGTDDPVAADALNRLADGLPVSVRMRPDGTARLEPQTSGIPGALTRLLAIVFTTVVGGNWARFKACRNDECRWVFYDASKNRSRRWCDMAECGNVINARAYRSRLRDGTRSGTG